MSKGYAPIPRIICDYPEYQEKPFSKGLALVELFRRATYDRQKEKGVLLVRGQVLVTIKGLAKEWGWSRCKVRYFLADLERKRGEAWAIEQEIIPATGLNPMRKPRSSGIRITFIYYNDICGERPK